MNTDHISVCSLNLDNAKTQWVVFRDLCLVDRLAECGAILIPSNGNDQLCSDLLGGAGTVIGYHSQLKQKEHSNHAYNNTHYIPLK